MKKSFKKLLLLTAAVIGGITFIVSCGDDDSEDEKTTNQTSQTDLSIDITGAYTFKDIDSKREMSLQDLISALEKEGYNIGQSGSYYATKYYKDLRYCLNFSSDNRQTLDNGELEFEIEDIRKYDDAEAIIKLKLSEEESLAGKSASKIICMEGYDDEDKPNTKTFTNRNDAVEYFLKECANGKDITIAFKHTGKTTYVRYERYYDEIHVEYGITELDIY